MRKTGAHLVYLSPCSDFVVSDLCGHAFVMSLLCSFYRLFSCSVSHVHLLKTKNTIRLIIRVSLCQSLLRQIKTFVWDKNCYRRWWRKKEEKKRRRTMQCFHHITVRAKFVFENDNTSCLRWWCQKTLVQQTPLRFMWSPLISTLTLGSKSGLQTDLESARQALNCFDSRG